MYIYVVQQQRRRFRLKKKGKCLSHNAFAAGFLRVQRRRRAEKGK